MGKLIKWLVGLVVVLVVLVIAAIVILPMVIDPNDYKAEIVSAVKEHTGRDLEIKDRIELSTFPWLGAKVAGVTLGNPAGYPKQPFAKVGLLEARLKVMPLLSGRAEIDTLVLDGVHAHLIKRKDGKGNWEDWGTEKKDGAGPEKKKDDGGGIDVKLAGVRITNASMIFEDQQAGTRQEVQGMRLTTGSLDPGKPVDLEFGLKFVSDKPQITTDLSLKGTITADAEFKRIQIADMEFTAEAEGDDVPSGKAELLLKAGVDLDQAAGSLALSKLEITGPEIGATGDIKVTQLTKSPQVNGTIRLSPTDVKKLAALFGVKIQTADEKALTSVSGDLKLSTSANTVRVAPLKLKLDDTNIDGELQVGTGRSSAVRFTINIDDLDLDRYLPPASDQPKQADKPKEAEKAGPMIPSDVIRGLDIKGSLAVAKLKANKLRLTDVSAKLVAKGGVLTLAPVKAKLYDGSTNMSYIVDARNEPPTVKVKQALTGVEIGKLLKDMQGDDTLSGKGNYNSDLVTRGQSDPEFRRNLNGTASFRFNDGAIKGFNVAHAVRSAKAKLGMGSAPAAEEGPPKTDFAELSGSARVTKGTVNNPDLSLKSPLLRVTGAGTAALPTEKLDYGLKILVVGSLEGQGGKGKDELSGIPIPLRITGTFSDPKYGLDTKDLAKEVAKSKLKERLGGGDAKGGIGGMLKGLSGGSDKDGGGDSSGGDAAKSDPKDKLKGLLKGF